MGRRGVKRPQSKPHAQLRIDGNQLLRLQRELAGGGDVSLVNALPALVDRHECDDADDHGAQGQRRERDGEVAAVHAAAVLVAGLAR